jgi:hypothetical protein
MPPKRISRKKKVIEELPVIKNIETKTITLILNPEIKKDEKPKNKLQNLLNNNRKFFNG